MDRLHGHGIFVALMAESLLSPSTRESFGAALSFALARLVVAGKRPLERLETLVCLAGWLDARVAAILSALISSVREPVIGRFRA